MTVAIKESLTRLNSSLVQLEKTASKAQAKVEKYQATAQELKAQKQAVKSASPDLFAVPNPAPAEDDIDAQALASRLDNAIERVEELLKEGA